MARRLVQIALGTALLMVVVAWGAVAWLAWYPDTLKAPLERLLTAQLGQQVRMAGPLRVDPGRITAVEVNGLHIAAPEWARSEEIVAIAHLRIAADLWDYLRHGRISITELAADAPRVVLERDLQARTSWPSGGSSGKKGAIPEISVGAVVITDGRFEFVDAPSQVDLAANLATEAATVTAAELRLDGGGRVRGDELRFGLRVGKLQQLAQGGASIPVDGSFTLAQTSAELKGVINEPATLAGLDLHLNIASGDPTGLLALVGRSVGGPAPPLAVKARLTGGGKAYAIDELHAQWGESALDGNLQADFGTLRPRLEGTLQVQRLDLATMLPLLTSPDQGGASSGASGNPLLPLAGYEGRLKLAATEINLPSGLVLRDSAAVLELADGKLRVAPIRVGLPEGVIQGELATGSLDAPELAIEARLVADGVGVAGVAGPGYGGRSLASSTARLPWARPSKCSQAAACAWKAAEMAWSCRGPSWAQCTSRRCSRTGTFAWTRSRRNCRKGR